LFLSEQYLIGRFFRIFKWHAFKILEQNLSIEVLKLRNRRTGIIFFMEEVKYLAIALEKIDKILKKDK
jgi:hypothetical protein